MEKVSFGGDSYVGRDGNEIHKFYNGGPFGSKLSRAQIYLYKEITNKAAKASWQLDGLGQVTVNPVKGLSYDFINNCWVTLSPYIEGTRLIALHDNLEDLASLRKKLWKLSNQMNLTLGVKGIQISEGNIMMESGRLIVTDLCTSIRALARTF